MPLRILLTSVGTFGRQTEAMELSYSMLTLGKKSLQFSCDESSQHNRENASSLNVPSSRNKNKIFAFNMAVCGIRISLDVSGSMRPITDFPKGDFLLAKHAIIGNAGMMHWMTLSHIVSQTNILHLRM